MLDTSQTLGCSEQACDVATPAVPIPPLGKQNHGMAGKLAEITVPQLQGKVHSPWSGVKAHGLIPLSFCSQITSVICDPFAPVI